MGSVLIVDGSDVCRAPIVAFLLRERSAGAGWSAGIVSRGLAAERDRTMCESAATRLGFRGPAIAFYGAHRATPLSLEDIASADLVLTAERAQRSAVVRMRPGTQASVFTVKEALVLSSVLVDRRRTSSRGAPADLAALAAALHSARGTVPLLEPAVRTGAFHWRRATAMDPLTIGSAHEGQVEHRRVVQETVDVASALGTRLCALMEDTVPEASLATIATRARRLRRTA